MVFFDDEFGQEAPVSSYVGSSCWVLVVVWCRRFVFDEWTPVNRSTCSEVFAREIYQFPGRVSGVLYLRDGANKLRFCPFKLSCRFLSVGHSSTFANNMYPCVGQFSYERSHSMGTRPSYYSISVNRSFVVVRHQIVRNKVSGTPFNVNQYSYVSSLSSRDYYSVKRVSVREIWH